MFALRCTQKLLKRGAIAHPSEQLPPTTTALGDWYANVLVARPEHLVVAVSERTMLPVVVTAKDVKRLPERLAVAVGEMLQAIGISPEQVSAEVSEMQVSVFSRTANRKVLGGLNEFMFQFECYYHANPGLPLHEYALKLAHTPSGVIEHVFPDRAARAVFDARTLIQRAKSAA